MKIWTITVYETREYRTAYTVEADTREEALEKAEIGDTVDEVDEDLVGILTREPQPETLEALDLPA